ncbi:carbohydrate ABC transporter permease [Salipaludibacillus aurantiacus]|uniref:Raffinose/stachyose/melibiose transport system permease protein n=1 Tax=Salipaludibacillus aurantiacus TaxID=1601833 RepID=A0A1H9UQQ3_9BACI|nr:carbohydrate ABC transporter permease [Salipaludibacillus aurantiacus]SES11716.1 raffinose/stachyose/melibiose transport system permease protein [Salipaludibacillus aurantiacus]
MSASKKSAKLGYIPVYLILLFFLIVTTFPFIWILISSLKGNAELMRSPFSLPETWQFANYVEAFSVGNLGRLFWNSLFVSTVSTAVCILFATMAAYAVRKGGKWSKIIYFTIIIGIFLPTNSLLVPYYLIAAQFNLINTPWALITTYMAMGLPLTLLIIYGFVRGVPQEIFESAEIDGCNMFQTYYRILLPLVRPGIATAAIFQFLFAWNEFIFALLLTTDQSVRTLQVGISLFKSVYQNDFTTMFAAIFSSLIPIIIIYIFLQKHIIDGLTSGSVKG